MRDTRKGAPGVIGPGLAAVVLLILPLSVLSADKVDVRYFAQGKKVIPVQCAIGNWQITDIKLPELVVTNRRTSPITVDRVRAIGRVSGSEVVRVQFSLDQLRDSIRGAALTINDPNTQLQSLQLSYGNVVLPRGHLSENGTAGPGQSVMLPLSEMASLHYAGLGKLDGMEILVTLRSGGTRTVVSFPVQLCPCQQKGTYLFPLRGDLRMASLPLSGTAHRSFASQEFAMDVFGANQPGAADFTDISNSNPTTLSDYGIWGREVLAVADGVVAGTGTRFPEDRMSDPALFTQVEYVTNLVKELIPVIGWNNAVAGNYVIVDHQNGEFSIYCHLQEGSIRVAPGARVAKGEVIAQVGNTGNSYSPHLHFQLMDSQDFFTANGLPLMFENIPAAAILIGSPVTANTLSFSDSIFGAVQ